MQQQHLHQTFFYQNPNTKQPSSSTLSSQQICRILCPATAKNPNGASRPPSSIISLDTLVIEYNPITNQYSEDGWVTLSKYPLFQYVASSWFYSESEEKGNEGKSNSVAKGPISCRDLAVLYYQTSNENKINDSTRVWSSSLASTTEDVEQNSNDSDKKNEGTKWTTIAEIPMLKLAIEAFEDVINISFFDGNDGKEKNTNAKAALKSTTTSSAETKFEFNEQDMVYEDEKNDNSDAKDGNEAKEEHELLLEEFLSSTAGGEGGDDEKNNGNDNDADEEEEYQSDGGTNYIKINGQWIDSADIPPSARKNLGKKRPLQSSSSTDKKEQKDDSKKQSQQPPKKKKAKSSKPKFTSKNAKHWIYVTNLPTDTNETEVATYFSKVGILDIDPETQKPKIKLYRERNQNSSSTTSTKNQKNKLKGDASICYANYASVQMAIQLLDDTIFRTVDPKTNHPIDYEITKKQKKIRVQQAKFEQKTDGDYTNNSKKKSSISDKKRQVARIAKLQAITWDEGDYNGRITGGIKGLRIIVLKHVFTIGDILEAKKKDRDNGEDKLLASIEHIVRTDCEQFGDVEKITIFSKNSDGVMIVKFTQPAAASDSIKFYNSEKKMVMNRVHNSNSNSHRVSIEASYWDGVTDYTVRDEVAEEEEMKKRHDEFGDWLDGQELPDEFKLNVE